MRRLQYPYTADEHTVHRFDRMVCEAYLGTVGAGSGAGAGDDDERDPSSVQVHRRPVTTRLE